MSTIQATNIKNAASASNNIVLDASGNATFAGTAAMASSFLRNRIINGGMAIDQRNAGASFSSGVGAITYGLDRFYVFATGAAFTGQRINPSLSGFPNALRLTGGAGVTFTEVGQRIESANIADLAGQTVTVSFVAAASVATSVTVYMNYANSPDNFTGSTGISSSAVAITSTMTRYTVSFNLPSQAANGVLVGWFFPSGLSSGTFTITGVQLEVGTVATPFERRQYGQELALCQRYFYRLTAATNFTNFGGGRAYASTNGQVFLALPVSMRAGPTGAISSLAHFNVTALGAHTAINPVAEYSGDFRQMTVDITAPYTGGQTIALNANNTTAAWMSWSAEL